MVGGVRVRWAAALLLVLAASALAQGTYEQVIEKYGEFVNEGAGKMGILELRNGYFYDPLLEEYVWPHGMAYQTWNKAIFQYQTLEQIEYDLREMQRMHVNSVRVEFTYPDTEDELYEFDKLDFLVNTAAKYGLRLFVVIGHQYLPESITDKDPDLLAVHYDMINDIFNRSTILNYNNPRAREVYRGFLSLVLQRYRDAPSVGAWVVGNEFAFYDLWEDLVKTKVHRFVGFDEEYSLPSYRAYLSEIYGGDIAALNAAWDTNHASFDVVPMELSFPPDRENQTQIQHSGYHDLIQWRKKSIGDFVAQGALVAKEYDPNHLITFAQLGGIFDGNDANTNCEDGPTIVARCAAAGAPLDLWTVNNYPWVVTGTELRSADFGVSKFRDTIGIPVLVSETGMSDTDILLPETAARMAKANPSLLWEAAISGAIGVHIFHWSDRDFYLSFPFPFEREAGFGMVFENRTMKPVWWNVLSYFRRMDEINLPRLLVNAKEPKKDVAVFWGEAVDLGYNRANQEIAMIWGTFKRMGLQPQVVNEQQFRDALFFDVPDIRAVYMPRCFQMTQETFAQMWDIVDRGLHIHATSDLPGRFTEKHALQPGWEQAMDELFGLNVTLAVPGFDSGVFKQNWTETYMQMLFYDLRTESPDPPFRDVWVWKTWREVTTTHGQTLFVHRKFENDTHVEQPSLHVTVPQRRGAEAPSRRIGKTAVHLHSIGDTLGNDIWNDRRDLMEAVYFDHFGMRGHIESFGNGSQLVVKDWRETENGSLLLFFMNLARYPANFTVVAPEFLRDDRFVLEDLTRGRLVSVDYATSTFPMVMDGDESVLLYYYARADSGLPQQSLANPARDKLWITEAPRRVWPNGYAFSVSVQYHVERTVQIGVQLQAWDDAGGQWRTLASSPRSSVVFGAGTVRLTVLPPLLHTVIDKEMYRSAQEGGVHRIVAMAYANSGVGGASGQPVSRTEVPTAVVWGVKVESCEPIMDTDPFAHVKVTWHELPSYLAEEEGSPLDRADIFPDGKVNSGREAYTLEVRLVSARTGEVVAVERIGHSLGSATNFTARVELPRPGLRHNDDVLVEAYMRPGSPDLDFVPSWRDYEEMERDWMWFERGGKIPARLGRRWQPFVYSSTNESFLMEVRVGDGEAVLDVLGNDWVRYGSYGWAYTLDYEVPLKDNAVVSMSHREQNGNRCNVSLQLLDENDNRKLIYKLSNGNAWTRLSAPMRDFQIDETGPSGNSSLYGYNNQTIRIVMNVQMLDDDDAHYEGHFGDLRIEGLNPDATQAVPASFPGAIGVHAPTWTMSVGQGTTDSTDLYSLAPPLFSPEENYTLDFPFAANMAIVALLACMLCVTVLCTIAWQSLKKMRVVRPYRRLQEMHA